MTRDARATRPRGLLGRPPWWLIVLGVFGLLVTIAGFTLVLVALTHVSRLG